MSPAPAAAPAVTLCLCGHAEPRHAHGPCDRASCGCYRYQAGPIIAHPAHRTGMPAVTGDSLYSTTDVVALTGATFRQLDYWDRVQLLRPAINANGSGSHRRFAAREVRVAFLVARLVEHFGLREAFTIAELLVDNGDYRADIAGVLTLTLTLNAEAMPQ